MSPQQSELDESGADESELDDEEDDDYGDMASVATSRSTTTPVQS